MRVRPLRSGPAAFALALLAVVVVTGALLATQSTLAVRPPQAAALVYLLAVWTVAAVTSMWPALVAAVLAFTALAYFFVPPLERLWGSSGSDWITLSVFLFVAVAQGLLTGRMRQQRDEAAARQRETDALVLLAEKLVSETAVADMASVVAEETAAVTHAARAGVIAPVAGTLSALGATPGFDPIADAGVERFARWSLENSRAVGLPLVAAESATGSWWPRTASYEEVVPGASRADLFIPLSAAGPTEGVLYVGPRPDKREHSLEDVRLAVSIAGLASVYLTRRSLEEEARQSRMLLEADLLKSTLVSSVSHELKTPLAAMTATVTGLLESDAVLEPEVVRRDLGVMRDGLERLNASIAALLDISRLESDAWRPTPEPCEVGDILGTVLSRLDASSRTRVSTAVAEDLPAIDVDFGQWARALGNVIDNALEYSGDHGQVRVSASGDPRNVRIVVEDDGPGIPVEERERIFEKFYRGSSAQRSPSGTGLGLTIAAEIVRFSGGDISVEAVMPHGSRFILSVPASTTEQTERGGGTDGG